MLRFALAGNPNSGKTTLFNSLTGSTAHVGNWPGVTVDKKEGVYKKCAEPIAIVDLPGIYSLSPYTQEEVIARNYILDEKPDCVINIIDATNLERNLYLTTQILEIDVPVILALNMMDAVEKRGDKIDASELEKRLGIPVVKISALKSTGLDKLMERAYETCKKPRVGKTVIEDSALKHLIGDVKIALEGQGVLNPTFHAVKLAELDELEVLMHKDTVNMVEAFKKTHKDEIFGDDFEALVADARYKYITKYFSPALKRKNEEKFTVTPSDKADKILTHKIWGIPIFLVVLFAIFHLTFSENLFFLGGLLPEGWVSFEGTAFEGVFGVEGINSPGVMLMGVMEVITTALSEVVSGWLSTSPEWVSGLICDGVLGGIFAILGFLPQILVLFLFFSILEDSGYMARIAFILDRALRKFGLSGRAFLPMIMGFGCSVPAMINTRTLADEKEKLATVRVIPFFSCGAKLPILTAVAGAIVMHFGVGNVDVITYGMYIVGIITALVAVILMRETTLKGDTPPFIMELPAYHAPQFKNLIMLLWDKAKHFIQKAFTIILASTIVIWVISHFDFGWNYLTDDKMQESILGGLGRLIQPLFTPLGFGSQLKAVGWVFAVAAISGLIAKENVVSTLGTLAACLISGAIIDVEADGGVGAVAIMIRETGITLPALLAFIAFNMTTIPCFAAVAAAKGEMPNKSAFKWTILFWIVTSYIVSSAVYLIGTAWWTAFIYVAVAVLVGAMIKLYNKKRSNKEKN
ncbi:MAG: ferrous iron transporter B [Clostridia bacterium]|nr:ferrous iron transporter B [Clostridia bacterium]MBR2449771.1 ferrous iron transporter B [Clostridia bacterium]